MLREGCYILPLPLAFAVVDCEVVMTGVCVAKVPDRAGGAKAASGTGGDEVTFDAEATVTQLPRS